VGRHRQQLPAVLPPPTQPHRRWSAEGPEVTEVTAHETPAQRTCLRSPPAGRLPRWPDGRPPWPASLSCRPHRPSLVPFPPALPRRAMRVWAPCPCSPLPHPWPCRHSPDTQHHLPHGSCQTTTTPPCGPRRTSPHPLSHLPASHRPQPHHLSALHSSTSQSAGVRASTWGTIVMLLLLLLLLPLPLLLGGAATWAAGRHSSSSIWGLLLWIREVATWRAAS